MTQGGEDCYAVVVRCPCGIIQTTG